MTDGGHRILRLNRHGFINQVKLEIMEKRKLLVKWIEAANKTEPHFPTLLKEFEKYYIEIHVLEENPLAKMLEEKHQLLNKTEKEKQLLIEAVNQFLELINNGVFVRDTSNDADETAFTLQGLKIVKAISNAAKAVNTE